MDINNQGADSAIKSAIDQSENQEITNQIETKQGHQSTSNNNGHTHEDLFQNLDLDLFSLEPVEQNNELQRSSCKAIVIQCFSSHQVCSSYKAQGPADISIGPGHTNKGHITSVTGQVVHTNGPTAMTNTMGPVNLSHGPITPTTRPITGISNRPAHYENGPSESLHNGPSAPVAGPCHLLESDAASVPTAVGPRNLAK